MKIFVIETKQGFLYCQDAERAWHQRETGGLCLLKSVGHKYLHMMAEHFGIVDYKIVVLKNDETK